MDDGKTPRARGRCGKVLFRSAAEAAFNARWTRRLTEDPVKAYHCHHCQAWHVGGTYDSEHAERARATYRRTHYDWMEDDDA